MSRRPLLPPTYFLFALVLMAALHFVAPLAQLIAWPWRLLGGLPILVGGALNVLCSRQFEQRGTTVKPFEESQALIVDGPFRYSRNPMYLGMGLIPGGDCRVAGNAHAVSRAPGLCLASQRSVHRSGRAGAGSAVRVRVSGL